MKKQFKDNLQSAVFTSKYVIEKFSPIISVVHHEDGTWEFWGSEIIDEKEIMIVSLNQIINIDPSLLEIADLPVQFTARRKSKDSFWELIPRN